MAIEAVSARHAGEYTCTASNAAGATSYSATLAVNGTALHEATCISLQLGRLKFIVLLASVCT